MLISPLDKDKNLKTYYDKLHTFNNASTATKEKKVIKLLVKRKSSAKILFDATGVVANNPLALYVLPYDSFGTLITDNIASCAFHFCVYFGLRRIYFALT